MGRERGLDREVVVDHVLLVARQIENLLRVNLLERAAAVLVRFVLRAESARAAPRKIGTTETAPRANKLSPR